MSKVGRKDLMETYRFSSKLKAQSSKLLFPKKLNVECEKKA